jgi:hypothetical protein
MITNILFGCVVLALLVIIFQQKQQLLLHEQKIVHDIQTIHETSTPHPTTQTEIPYEGVVQTIHEGRGVGNLLFLYTHQLLLRKKNKQPLPPIDEKIKQLLPHINESYRFEIGPLWNMTGIWKDTYPHDVRFYLPYRKHLQKWFGTDNIQSASNWTVHVRLDDIGNQHQGFTPLPSSYYKNITHEPVRLVYRHPHDIFTNRCLEVVKSSLTVRDLHFPAEKDAFSLLMKSTNLILPVSSFGFWAAFLSPVVKRIIAPAFGCMLCIEPLGGLCLEHWPMVELRGNFTKITRVEELI